MKIYHSNKTALTAAVMIMAMTFGAMPARAFESGSTGADGAFSPTVNSELQLPPSGIFNFTTVNIPTGVTVTFKKNTTNTPVVILASGNVTIAGSINLGGGTATDSGTAGDGNLGDDGIPGKGGPGGYDGGAGGIPGPNVSATLLERYGGPGLGPGGGNGGHIRTSDFFPCGGGGAGYGANGGNDGCGGTAGTSYGSTILLPLVGGSGGGGGAGGTTFKGSGGGGGAGALLIASSGTVSITGSILANGGRAGATGGQGAGNPGGGGSGGAIRIVATTISGNGTIQAIGGTARGGTGSPQATSGGAGSVGRVRLEAENITRTAASSPAHVFGAPGTVFVAGLPTLRITSVAGVTAPAEPTGNADITLPLNTPSPMTVTFQTTGVPVGNTVKLTIKPANAPQFSAISLALTGTTDNATASVDVTLPTGPSTLEATTTYTIVASLGDALGVQYAQGERVEKIEVAASLGGPSVVTLITVSGKRFPMPGPLPAMAVAS